MAWAESRFFKVVCNVVLLSFFFQVLDPIRLGFSSASDFPSRSPDSSPLTTLLNFVLPAAHAQGAAEELLASTPEADLADPYIINKAAELGNDPQQIFAFVRDEIKFESYAGSLRGARGTLWSQAGNALDQASLLIALLRVSGIPAWYVQGTLDRARAQELIASMFLPAPYRVVGFVPDDAEKSDPVNDPALIAEAQQHFWVEFDAGGGFVVADPSFTGAQINQTFASAQGQFAEVPDNLRHKVTVRLKAEKGGSAFNPGLETTTVLNQTFTSAELVGKPLSIGHFVNTQAQGSLVGANFTHTYSPYILIGQNDGNINDDPTISISTGRSSSNKPRYQPFEHGDK